jgi:ribosomal protein S18 acetylase RimI-like enzyme
MQNASITFYKANPTIDEGREFAHYLDEAAEGFFHFMLGRQFVEIIANAFIQQGHDLSHQNATFARRNKIIVGMVSGYTAEQHRQSSDRPLKQAAGRFNLRMIAVSTLFSPLFRIIDNIADDDFYLQAMAVNKELRGEGIGSTLMDYAEDCARACGSSRLSLDVSAGNKGARKLYEQRGMTVESQWPKRIPIPGMKFFRMVKEL